MRLKKKKVLNIHLLIILLIIADFTTASTVFFGRHKKTVLAAVNEDNPDLSAEVWFVPAEGGKLGAAFFGFNDQQPRGGMNDKGLFCNLTVCPRMQVSPNPEKSTLFGNLIEQILTTCKSIKDVKKLHKKYNLYDLHQAQILVADKSGKSIIIEGDLILPMEGKYQLMTNFYHSNPDLGNDKHPRYDQADKLLQSGEVSVDSFRKILSRVHLELETPTVYSLIYDLKKRLIYLYYFHDFENPHIINLKKELKKGAHSREIQALFDEQSLAQIAFYKFNKKQNIMADFRQGRSRRAVREVLKWQDEDPEFDSFPEYELNMLGYEFMNAGYLDGAIEVFKLNVALYPESANVYDSLGESYMNNDQKELAIFNYEKSLELNPENTNAVDMLKKIRENN